MIRHQVAQGDVLFTPLSALPAVQRPQGKLTPVPAENGRYILARGEVTGHHHSTPTGTTTLNLDEGGVMWLTVEELTAVEHQEHGPCALVPEVEMYRVDLQSEFGWEGWRQVAD